MVVKKKRGGAAGGGAAGGRAAASGGAAAAGGGHSLPLTEVWSFSLVPVHLQFASQAALKVWSCCSHRSSSSSRPSAPPDLHAAAGHLFSLVGPLVIVEESK